MIHVRGFFLGTVLALLTTLTAFAGAEAGTHYLKIDGRTVYVDHLPAASGKATLVLLNGLTYSTKDWDAYTTQLRKRAPGFGILRFDMIGMGQTLLKGTLPVNYGIPYTDQVELTAKVMRQLGIEKAFVAGLSYGGGIAIAFGTAHPEMVEQLILMAPFTEPLQAMDQFIRNEVAGNRLTFPLNPASDDELYDFFLRQFIYATYPSLEPSVLDNPYKLEAIFRMTQGIRHWDTLGATRRSLNVATHLMVAAQDQYIPREVHDRFWSNVPSSARASRIVISRTEHKIPEAVPAFAAAWTAQILNGASDLNQGYSFDGNTDSFTAVSSNGVQIPLSR